VVFNDLLALPILDQLSEERVRVPDELSVVSFDNTMPAQLKGLSSYSFNYPAIVNAMLEHILDPKRTRSGDGVVEVPGMVVERQTSGSVSAETRS